MSGFFIFVLKNNYMDKINLFKDIVLVLAFAIPVIYLCHKIKLPQIIGFIITGIIIGPYGLSILKDSEGVRHLAELGVAMLLFSIGIEISFSRFKKFFKEIVLTGGLQVGLTLLLGFLTSLVFKLSVQQSIFMGFLLTQSSSALILKLLNDRNEINAPQGKLSVGILIFQDLMIVPMIILIPVLGSAGNIQFFDVIKNISISLVFIVCVLISAKYILPKILKALVDLKMRDVFIVGVIVILLGTAWITNLMGLSFAIGAFIAGLIISESDYAEQIIGEVIPLKEVFMSLFFISLGMLLDSHFLISHPLTVLHFTIIILLIKFIVIFALIYFIGYPTRLAFVVAVILSQIGEFSFILASSGLEANLISEEIFKGMIAASIITLLITPVIFQFVHPLSFKIPNITKKKFKEIESFSQSKLSHHVIIIGFGLNGKNLVQVLKETGINYIVIETNPLIFRKAKENNEKIVFGDASNKEVLQSAGIEGAKIVVFAISDPVAIKIGIKNAKQLSPDCFIIVRTLYVKDIDNLISLGADEVIPEEFETSIQIFSRVLKLYHIPQSVIYTQSNIIRNQSYGLLRDVKFIDQSFSQINQILAQGTIDIVYISKGNIYIGKTLKELDLRTRTGSTIISIVRNNDAINSPGSHFKIQDGDQIIIFGNHISIDNTLEFFKKAI